ncbi:GNAT family N-acetyltransferase [Nocardia sp. CNY236]|uniref:GNAT family N-acetyltransferase n=1 Tax=Nocardia sp. CNY236 TaxID=1169152 RepID=UPI000410D8B4|nr:GNAT family N-acetyltransferase [Nocardia sp. CNY236]
MVAQDQRPWLVRSLAAEHIYSLAQCHIACWREAYRRLVPGHVLDAFDIAHCADRWERERIRTPGRVQVALIDQAVIGFASGGPSRAPHAATLMDLDALYVRSAWHGSGVADDLLRAALDPAKSCSLWVFEHNGRAQAFYRKHGFEFDGTRRIEPFTCTPEVRMVRGPVPLEVPGTDCSRVGPNPRHR